MKKVKQLFVISLVLLLFTSKGYAQSNYQEEIKSDYREALLTGEGALALKYTHKKLERELVQDRFNPQLKYWLAYDEYYMAKYYELRGRKDFAKRLYTRGIERLKAIRERSSEDYALLSLLQYAYFKLCNLKHNSSLAREMEANSRQALALEPKNIRANVAWGIIELAKPRVQGKVKEGEVYLLDAIENLFEQTIESESLPSWGKEEAYEALIRYYIKVKRREEAIQYIEEFEEFYPHSLQIDRLKILLRH